MVRAMALDFADKGVRVNAIAPGFIETDLARGIAAQEPDPEAAMRTRRAMHAIPRAGRPEEIGEAAAYPTRAIATIAGGAKAIAWPFVLTGCGIIEISVSLAAWGY
jgi:NAD(P)-dependent dehydrogenase (short-subunit alcohol dehydrogenase family)